MDQAPQSEKFRKLTTKYEDEYKTNFFFKYELDFRRRANSASAELNSASYTTYCRAINSTYTDRRSTRPIGNVKEKAKQEVSSNAAWYVHSFVF